MAHALTSSTIDLIGHRRAIDLAAEVAGDRRQALAVGAVGRRDRRLSIHLHAGIVSHALHFSIAEGGCLHGLQAGIEHGVRAHVLAAGQQGGECEGRKRELQFHGHRP